MTLNQLTNNGDLIATLGGVKFKSAKSGKIFVAYSRTEKGKFLVENDEGEELLLKGDEDRYLPGENPRIGEIKLALAALDNQAEGLVAQIDTLENQKTELENELEALLG